MGNLLTSIVNDYSEAASNFSNVKIISIGYKCKPKYFIFSGCSFKVSEIPSKLPSCNIVSEKSTTDPQFLHYEIFVKSKNFAKLFEHVIKLYILRHPFKQCF